MSSRQAHHAPVPGTNPKASPLASPLADYGPPPAGVPLLYVHDPNNVSWLIGYDWSGNPRGTVKLDPSAPFAVQMAPDGSAFEAGGTYKGGTFQFFDRLGRPIPHWRRPNQRCRRDVGRRQQEPVPYHFRPEDLHLGAQHRSSRPGGAAGGRHRARLERRSDRHQPGCLQRHEQRRPCAAHCDLLSCGALAIRLSDGKILSHRTYARSSCPW